MEDNRRESAKVVQGALEMVSLLKKKILKMFKARREPPGIHGEVKGWICGEDH